MKGLLKYLSPFAPDQSGAVSVLYEMGGITVVCDAGGCIGNICGFDEPRWILHQSALFSAGLRDMDAILGRDDRMILKLRDTAEKLDCSFAALIGTPVPAVIATDFKAMKRMGEKKCGMPVLTVECTGTRLYDRGAQDAWVELFDRFATEKKEVLPKKVGILGLTPIDLSRMQVKEEMDSYFKNLGYEEVVCYGMGDGLESVKNAASVSENILVAPSALKAAKLLEKRFGTPYRCMWPDLDPEEVTSETVGDAARILVIHQQIAANAMRDKIRSFSDAEVICATFFMQDKDLKEEGDLFLSSEEDLIKAAEERDFDLIIADQILMRAVRHYEGRWLHMPHFALSGELRDGK